METPIYSRLCAYRNENRIPFAMPGHKNMRGFDSDLEWCDVTELPRTLNLMGDDETVRRACRLLSDLYGARDSFILTCGSTAGVHAMILSCLNPGDTLLAMSDCHKSVIGICAIAGIRIKFVKSVCRNSLTDDVDGVLITSPNYYGIVKDIKAISELCAEKDIPLMVDEAHGAHFTGRFGLPESSVKLGADIVCQSAHKTLCALTGAAYLHRATERIDINRIRRAVETVHTTSPSYPVAASADIARAKLARCDYSDIINECRGFKAEIEKIGIIPRPTDDPTRIVLDFSKIGITGFAVAEKLSDEYGTDVEMADLKNTVLIATPYNVHSDFGRLAESLKKIVSESACGGLTENLPEPPVIEGVFSPSDGWFAKTEFTDLDAAAGRIAARTVSVYPPGCAVAVMGGKIGKDAVLYLNAALKYGADVTGITDGKIEVAI